MQRTPHRCPQCAQAVWIHADMWGHYYMCDDCGWTAEDDAALAAFTRKPQDDVSVSAGLDQPFSQRPGAFS